MSEPGATFRRESTPDSVRETRFSRLPDALTAAPPPPSVVSPSRPLARVASFAFFLSTLATVVVTRAWPDAQAPVVAVLVLAALLVLAARELLPGRGETAGTALIEAAIGFSATAVVCGLTGGIASPFIVGFPLLACAVALTRPGWSAAIATALAVAGLWLAAWLGAGAPGLSGGIGGTGGAAGTLDAILRALPPDDLLRLALGALVTVALAVACNRGSRDVRQAARETALATAEDAARRRALAARPTPMGALAGNADPAAAIQRAARGGLMGRLTDTLNPARGATLAAAGHLLPGREWAPGMEVPATGTLAVVVPEHRRASARITFEQRQLVALALGGAALGAAMALWPLAVLTIVAGGLTAIYVAVFVYRTASFWSGFEQPDPDAITDAQARAIPDADLPVYTILVPAYREAEVIGNLIASIDRLEYPRDKLDVLLLLEADDQSTHDAAHRMIDGPHVRVITIQPGGPRTKPNACNIGLMVARGRYVTIFDAEDRPEPLQLRRAVVAFERAPDDVACVQARLLYHNHAQNLLTRWFAIEYSMWFRHLLPGLVRAQVPVPLGGTSNHFRRDVLEAVGAWDPWNVTEDADLGIRLHRLGYRTRMLDSTTLEEANSDVVNWIKQRSRWYKGYMQTWLVHMRHPLGLAREMGLTGFASFSLFVGGTPFISLVNPILWVSTLFWFLVHPPLIQQLFSGPVYYLGLVAFLGGNFSFLYTTILSARATEKPALVFAAVTVPVYWALMSVAAIKALIQLIAAPSFWEKTLHGLDLAHAAAAGASNPGRPSGQPSGHDGQPASPPQPPAAVAPTAAPVAPTAASVAPAVGD